MASPRSNSNLSRHSSNASFSRPGHPMSVGSYMLQAAEEPIQVTHTQFTAAAPRTPPPAPPPPSPPKPPSTVPAQNPINVWKVRCLLYATSACAFVGLCLVIGGIVAFQIASSRTNMIGVILLSVGVVFLCMSFVACGLFYWVYKVTKEKNENNVILTATVRPIARSQEEQDEALLRAT